MKFSSNWLVRLYQPEAESAKWRFLLRFLGIETVVLRDEKELEEVLVHGPKGLLIFDRSLLTDIFPRVEQLCMKWFEHGGGIAVTGEVGIQTLPLSFLTNITDISERDPFTINSLLQQFVPTYSRQHPRLATRLPGLYSRSSEKSKMCEIVNLSPGGAFIRTTEALPLSGELVEITVPLIGLRKEIELRGRVINLVLPTEQNNYLQGIGVRFVAEEDSIHITELNDYMRYVLTHDEVFDRNNSTHSGTQICKGIKKSASRSVKGRDRTLAPIN